MMLLLLLAMMMMMMMMMMMLMTTMTDVQDSLRDLQQKTGTNIVDQEL